MDWSFVFSAVATGLAVVFIILLILVLLMVVMGKLSGKLGEKPLIPPPPEGMKSFHLYTKPSEAETEKTPVAALVKRDEDEDLEELEIIAVITAAIRMFAEESGKIINIVDVHKREKTTSELSEISNRRSAWGNAGVSESMKGWI